ncbi:hypothetical protein [Cupriavidus metallidurans]|uniref:hypothetical protein n=1 Tax=Cupriavidus metallidurans TaxID=119219 RepID=UPI001646CF84|nr:hypothetical protein [Cupriavidus metallidurans]
MLFSIYQNVVVLLAIFLMGMLTGAWLLSAYMAFIQRDHLEQAKRGAYLCRVEAKYRDGMGFVPIYTHAKPE